MNERVAPKSPDEQGPGVLVIGGADPTGAAGVGADLKTLAALGIYGASVVTAVTVQNSRSVSDVVSMPASVVGAQIDAAFFDVDVQAVKTGALFSVDTVHVVADRAEASGAGVRWIVDPVIASSSGRDLLDEAGRRVLLERLIPRAALVTPNLAEASWLTGVSVDSPDAMSRAADHFLALGASAVLIKGGHLPDFDPELGEVTDLLRTVDGDEWRFSRTRLPGSYRGTGCCLASAIAARVAEGRTLRASVEQAGDYLAATMARSVPSRKNASAKLLVHGLTEAGDAAC